MEIKILTEHMRTKRQNLQVAIFNLSIFLYRIDKIVLIISMKIKTCIEDYECSIQLHTVPDEYTAIFTRPMMDSVMLIRIWDLGVKPRSQMLLVINSRYAWLSIMVDMYVQ